MNATHIASGIPCAARHSVPVQMQAMPSWQCAVAASYTTAGSCKPAPGSCYACNSGQLAIMLPQPAAEYNQIALQSMWAVGGHTGERTPSRHVNRQALQAAALTWQAEQRHGAVEA